MRPPCTSTTATSRRTSGKVGLHPHWCLVDQHAGSPIHARRRQAAVLKGSSPAACHSCPAAHHLPGPKHRRCSPHGKSPLSDDGRGPAGIPSQWWFGGGTDITPSYLYPEDMRHFHSTYKARLITERTARIGCPLHTAVTSRGDLWRGALRNIHTAELHCCLLGPNQADSMHWETSSQPHRV